MAEKDKNVDTTNASDTNIDSILIIRERGESQEYSVSDSSLEFDVEIAEDGELRLTGGQIKSPYFIRNSELEYIRTWRYTVVDVEIVGFHVNAKENMITYGFLARDFVDASALEEDKADG